MGLLNFFILMTGVTSAWSAKYVLDLYVVVEYSVLERYNSLHHYSYYPEEEIFRLSKAVVEKDLEFSMNEVNKYFNTLRPYGLEMEIRVVRTDFKTKDMEGFMTLFDIAGKKRLFLERDHFGHKNVSFDAVAIMTGDRFDHFNPNGDSRGVVLEEGSVCNRDKAWILSEYRGTQRSALELAHLIARLLGAGDENKPSACTSTTNIMSTPLTGLATKERTFSKCTADSIEKTMSQWLSAEEAEKKCEESDNCLLDDIAPPPAKFDVQVHSNRSIMNPTDLCYHYTWAEYVYHCNTGSYADKLCQGLYCSVCHPTGNVIEGIPDCSPLDPNCKSRQCDTCMPFMPTEGMSCGRGKVCMKSKCVYQDF